MLRPYQEECLQKVKEAFLEFNRVLIVMSTGSGKTILFNDLAKQFVSKNKNVLVLAHREELLFQAAEKMERFNSIPFSMIKSGYDVDMSKHYFVASVQSLCKEDRLKKFPKDFWSLIICDEAHHLTAKTYQDILNYFENYKLLGVTATERKSEAKKFASMFDTKAYEYDIRQMITEGYGSKIIARNANISVDLTNVRVVSGDFCVNELDREVSKKFDTIANYINNELKYRRSILIFTPRVESAIALAENLQKKGMSAAAISGKSKDRADKILHFKNGDIRILVNAILLSEGTDIPQIDCIINLRPTLSTIFYNQVIGRGLRLAPKKENCLVVDCLWNTSKDVLHPANIFAKEESVCRMMKDFLVSNVNRSFDMMVLEKYFDFACHFKEMESARLLTFNNLTKKGLKDYRIFAFIFNHPELLQYEPIYGWEMLPPTQKQVEFIEKSGISSSNLTKGLASKIIDVIIKRIEKKQCTVKQVFFMSSKGIFDKAPEITFDVAREIMDSATKNYWRIPYHYIKEYGGDERLKTSLLKVNELDIKPVEEGDNEWAKQI